MSEEEAALERAGGGLWAMVRSLGLISREIEIHVCVDFPYVFPYAPHKAKEGFASCDSSLPGVHVRPA